MKLEVTLTYGDDKKEKFTCIDYPSHGDFITLYREDFERTSIKSNTVTRIETRFIKK